MPLPRGDEYNQAVQSPALNFADPVLRTCRVETNPLGLPKPYSGGFTTTYKFLNGSTNWAVRCFTREIRDLQQRYQSIGNFQNINTCPFLVEAKYVSNGIRVNGIFHPIIKMKWQEGDTLNNYISRNYNNKTTISLLIDEFTDLIGKLENFGIAHGDLQHGNIIIKNNKMYLIDYDGMYIPDIAGLIVNELGHPNFQHPKRSANEYNKNIDRFSAQVIYTALKAIYVNPNLWGKYDNGDNLLFKSQDFNDPQHSPIFSELATNSELRKLSNNLLAISTWEFNRIPSLNDFINQQYTPSITPIPATVPRRSAYLVIDGNCKGLLLENVGQRVEVIGQICTFYRGITRLGKPYIFLNFGYYPEQTFTIVLWSNVLEEFSANGIDPTTLKDKYVSVTGVLSQYCLVPQIPIDNRNQIQILSGLNEANQRLNYRASTITSSPRLTDAETLNRLYGNRPVTIPVAPITPSRQTVTPPRQTVTPPRQTVTPQTSYKKDTGCTFPIIFAIVGAIIGGIISPDIIFIGLIAGLILGGIIKS